MKRPRQIQRSGGGRLARLPKAKPAADGKARAAALYHARKRRRARQDAT